MFIAAPPLGLFIPPPAVCEQSMFVDRGTGTVVGEQFFDADDLVEGTSGWDNGRILSGGTTSSLDFSRDDDVAFDDDVVVVLFEGASADLVVE